MKRKRPATSAHHADKRQRRDCDQLPTYPLLRQYYADALSLRQYLVSRLPKCAKKRRRKLQHYGSASADDDLTADVEVSELLDTVVVGIPKPAHLDRREDTESEITVFTQQFTESTATSTPTQGAFKQSEIVAFTIWSLFRRYTANHRPPHMLCHGFQRSTAATNGCEPEIVPGVPGILSYCRNRYVQTFKEHPWSALPSLLGSRAEHIISEMLMDCGLFISIGLSSSLSQVSGTPMSDLKALASSTRDREHEGTGNSAAKAGPRAQDVKRGLSEIRFVRHRMLYARPSLNSHGKEAPGLSHVHVLNRCTDLDDADATLHLTKYLFPLQFGLHNVLTSQVDRRETSQPFPDYTCREKEIAQFELRRERKLAKDAEGDTYRKPWVPKRLRGEAIQLTSRLRKRHSRCSYAALLQHYCSQPNAAGNGRPSDIAMATSSTKVSAFCRAVVLTVIPGAFLGKSDTGKHNKAKLTNSIDRFVHLRRYETMTLHDVMQGIQLDDISWLASPKTDARSKPSLTDHAKRKELMTELLYWLFESFLIPLLRSHFYVTESSLYRNQLFYFRHDVWKALSEPALHSLKGTMFETCDMSKVKQLMAKRTLGVSSVRLLPKGQGMRPIINLRRRIQRRQHGDVVLGKSINSILTPAFSVLNCEKMARRYMLGSALLSVSDIHGRLQAFRQALSQQGVAGKPLYFAKVDVQACFDTIPQKRLMQLLKTIVTTAEYRVARYARAKLLGGDYEGTPAFGAKPSWKFLTKATRGSEILDFQGEAEDDAAGGRSRTVYVDGVVQKCERREAILNLLEEHVESNLIRLGNRFYRQREGIAQGSIVSSLLCTYFYAELERVCLGFLSDGQTLLLRLIDDFLVISTKRDIAERFVHTMHNGIPEFGVQVKLAKSRANFDVKVNGVAITRLPSTGDFPYCGSAINAVTLDISKDKDRRQQSNIQDSMTVESSKLPGQTFYRKALNMLKLQMHAMLLSTKYNGLQTVLGNLYHAFTEVAQKCYFYVKSLPLAKQPGWRLMIKAVDDLIKLACVVMKRRKPTAQDCVAYECSVTNAQARWLACTAFCAIFQKKQTKHRILLAWVKAQLGSPLLRAQGRVLGRIVAAYHR